MSSWTDQYKFNLIQLVDVPAASERIYSASLPPLFTLSLTTATHFTMYSDNLKYDVKIVRFWLTENGPFRSVNGDHLTTEVTAIFWWVLRRIRRTVVEVGGLIQNVAFRSSSFAHSPETRERQCCVHVSQISLKPAISKTQLAWASTGLNAISLRLLSQITQLT